MKSLLIISALLATQISTAVANTEAVNKLQQDYLTAGAVTGNASKGQQLWNKKFAGEAPYAERSCTSCHTDKLSNTGKHIRTAKSILPMAPSVNKDRLTNINDIEKWFKRNCKWTLGRECTVQEKTDLITFINQQ